MAQPTQQECEKYYYLWRDGRNNDEIAEALSFSAGRMTSNMPYFLHYAKNKYKEDFRNGMVNGNPPHLELTEERRTQFLKLSSSGLDYIKVSKIMNIPLPTIMEVWFVKDPAFKDEVDSIREVMDARVIQALYKKAIGYRTTTRTVTKMKGIGEKGSPIESTTVVKAEKIVDGDFNAQKFWAINRMPDAWSADGTVNKDGNKGQIMKMIDNAVDENALLDDKRFDEEQRAQDEKAERTGT